MAVRVKKGGGEKGPFTSSRPVPRVKTQRIQWLSQGVQLVHFEAPGYGTVKDEAVLLWQCYPSCPSSWLEGVSPHEAARHPSNISSGANDSLMKKRGEGKKELSENCTAVGQFLERESL